jgi:glyoxylase-like metal-dependent hydrolase (beta-lactamase superfamily II)
MTSPSPAGRQKYAPPLVQGEPVQVVERVYVIPDRRVPLVPNVGIVVGDTAALVVDTGVGPRNGALVLDHARRLAPCQALYLAITQLDPGHAFGAQAFDGVATIVFSAAQQERLRTNVPGYADVFRALGTTVAEQLEGLRLVEPTIVFDEKVELDLGGVHATIEAWGPAHTIDDVTVTIDDRAIFTGDLFETRMFPILPYFSPFDIGFNGARWLDALDRVIVRAPAVVIPGHGETTDIGQIREVRNYLSFVQAETDRLCHHGLDVEHAADSIETAARSRWPDWDVPEWIRYAVRAFSEQKPTQVRAGSAGLERPEGVVVDGRPGW